MRILDLYCGAGGAGVGYRRAGFDVVGIDIEDQPDYPQPSSGLMRFRQTNALEVLRTIVFGLQLADFDAIHASPPCQASSALTKGTNRATRAAYHVDLIPATRDLLNQTGLPYVIENVQGAQVRRDLTLCGEMFGLGVIRHRYFELGGWSTDPVEHVPHRGRVRGWRHGVYHEGPYLAVHGEGGGKGTVAEWQQAMGIDWTSNRKSIAEAIPPAYTELVGSRLMARLGGS